MAKGETYEEFVEKFKPKKTTDDCYTPNGVYDVIASWVRNRYELGQDVKFVRPFYPGGDYERCDYPSGCAVVDKPPFSILGKIIRFYLDRKIKFFLFCDTRNSFYYLKYMVCSVVLSGEEIVYENGAKIRTSYLTNMSPEIMFECAPELGKQLEACFPKKQGKKNIIDYHFVSGIDADCAAGKGFSVRVPRSLSRLSKKAIFGHPVIVRADIAKAVEKAKAKEKEKGGKKQITKQTIPEDAASIEELDASLCTMSEPLTSSTTRNELKSVTA